MESKNYAIQVLRKQLKGKYDSPTVIFAPRDYAKR